MPPAEVLHFSSNVNFDSNINELKKQNLQQLSSRTYKETLSMVTYVVNKALRRKQKWNKRGEKLYELCKEMKYKHEPFFDSLSQRININELTLDSATKDIMKETLKENSNFGRIVSVVTFCMVLCEQCSTIRNLCYKMDIIITSTVEVIDEHKWFERNNGWDGLMQFFITHSDRVWKGIFITTVGLGAMAGILYAKS